VRYIEVDYGQIEARVLGMASKDRKFCHALRNNLDVHMAWAEKLVDAYPIILKLRGSRNNPLDMKGWRKYVKNEWTFPLFYGAGQKTVAGGTKIPEHIIEDLIPEFWDEFPGVKLWQIDTKKFYDANGYVQALTGTRTYAPLKYNKIINAPIQGTAACICVWAHTEICRIARKLQKPWLIPVNNVHDALWFHVPDKHVEYVIKLVVKVMLSAVTRFAHFMNKVPLTVEVEEGPTLYDMKSVGTYSSATTH